jgi:hypothetical protein
VVAWHSGDGVEWDSTVVDEGDEMWHPHLLLATDGYALLIGGVATTAAASVVEAVLPDDLIEEIRAGRLDLVRAGDPMWSVSVVAPPGIEVYRADLAAPIEIVQQNLLLHFDKSREWSRVDVSPDLITWPGLVARPGRGFLARTSTGEIYTTVDGRGWGRNRTIPLADFTRWGDWLVGIEVQPWSDRLVIGSGTEYAWVEQPVDRAPIWSDGGQVIGGPSGLLSVVPTYAGPAAEVSINSGSQRFTLKADMFSIAEPGTEAASVFFHSLPGSFNSTTDEVVIDIAGADRVVIDVDRLQVLRAGDESLWVTGVYSSADGLDWWKAQTQLRGRSVTALGPVPGGFLLSVNGSSGRRSPPELYLAQLPPIG